LLIGCRIHPETCVLVRRVSRLAEPGRTFSVPVEVGWTRCRIFAGLSLAQDPVAGFSQVPRNSDGGSAMSLAWREPLIEAFDMGAAIGPDAQRAGGGLDESVLRTG